MGEFHARGLPASWLNGWLAAVGAAVLVPDLRLAWTDDAVPLARFELDIGSDVAEAIAEALPTLEDLQRLAIARHRPDAPELPRTATLNAFRSRAELVQSGVVVAGDRSLEMSVTDLYDLRSEQVPHAPFDPPVPKGVTLYERVVACRKAVEGLGHASEVVRASLLGRGRRVQNNGLGFDYRRSADSVHADSERHSDPVVETLAFFGLHLFPLRGNGRTKQQPRQRGFTDRASRRHAFRWPCWDEPLDVWAIDALLDRFHALGKRRPDNESEIHWDRQAVATLRRLGVHGVYGSVYQQPRGQADSYRAFASERLR
jgi:hypothetical protein